MGMAKKHMQFADEYLIDFNGTRAYKVVYPKVKNDATAAVSASKLLRTPKVKAYIDEKINELHNEKMADAREVLEYLTSVMRNEQTEDIVVVEGTGDGYSKARTEKKDTSIKDRVKAAELLGKRYSLFTEKVEHDGVGNVVILNDIPESEVG